MKVQAISGELLDTRKQYKYWRNIQNKLLHGR